MLSRVVENTSTYNLDNRNMLREVTVKISLERIDMQEGVTVEMLLDSEATVLVMSLEFARKQGFRLKKIERLIYIYNMDRTLNKKGPIENTVEINIYYQGHRERTEIDVIRGQKWNVILEMLQLIRHNPEIDQRIGEVKMTRCSEKCEKQWRSKQKKLRWQKQKEKEKRKKAGRKREKKAEKKKEKKKPKKERKIEVRKVVEEQEIWNKKEKAAKSKAEARKLVLERFHKWIYVFSKKTSEQISIRKLWNHVIDISEEFVLRKGKVYSLLRKEREEVCEFILEQLRKEYIRLLKLPQIAPVFFVGKKDRKKQIVQNYWYLNEWTVENNYPLPLISNIVENIGTKRVFTKMNLQQGYNNI